MSRLLVALLVGSVGLVAACGGKAAALSDNLSGETCPDNSSTIDLNMSPNQVLRGDAVSLEITWTVRVELLSPTATLLAGLAEEVEVEMGLSDQVGTDPIAYRGTMVNPFGVGAPAGLASVLAQAAIPAGCNVAPTATTSFVLE